MNRLDRLFVLLTASPGPSYAAWMATAGVTAIVLGAFFLVLGRPGNAGLSLIGAGLFSLAVGGVSVVVRRRN